MDGKIDSNTTAGQMGADFEQSPISNRCPRQLKQSDRRSYICLRKEDWAVLLMVVPATVARQLAHQGFCLASATAGDGGRRRSSSILSRRVAVAAPCRIPQSRKTFRVNLSSTKIKQAKNVPTNHQHTQSVRCSCATCAPSLPPVGVLEAVQRLGWHLQRSLQTGPSAPGPTWERPARGRVSAGVMRRL